jgi:dihydroorotase
MRTIFKNISVVNADGVFEADVFIEEGKIHGVYKTGSDPSLDLFHSWNKTRVVEGKGKFLLPGAIDSHVHFREPGASHKETWETGSQAAVMGGVTTVLDMPNNNPAIVTCAALKAKRELIEGRSYVNYGLFFGATGNGNLKEIEKTKGIVGVKIYMGSSTGDLLVNDSSMWEDVFRVCREKDIPAVVHAEDEDRIRERHVDFIGKHRLDHEDKEPGIELHSKIRDCECAKLAVDEAIRIREKIKNRLHIAHMSCARELELVRAHAHEDLSCEVCPHHLYFSAQDMEDAFLKMNPPLRHPEDLVKMWEGLRDGSINCVSTDHAPHTKDEKAHGLSSPSGVPGVEFMLPLMLNEVNSRMMDMHSVVRALSAEPARIFSLKGKGKIAEGFDADLVVVDMDKKMTITEEMVQSKCGWTPYLGYEIKGWPVMTFVHGELVMEDREMVGGFAGQEVELALK